MISPEQKHVARASASTVVVVIGIGLALHFIAVFHENWVDSSNRDQYRAAHASIEQCRNATHVKEYGLQAKCKEDERWLSDSWFPWHAYIRECLRNTWDHHCNELYRIFNIFQPNAATRLLLTHAFLRITDSFALLLVTIIVGLLAVSYFVYKVPLQDFRSYHKIRKDKEQAERETMQSKVFSNPVYPATCLPPLAWQLSMTEQKRDASYLQQQQEHHDHPKQLDSSEPSQNNHPLSAWANVPAPSSTRTTSSRKPATFFTLDDRFAENAI